MQSRARRDYFLKDMTTRVLRPIYVLKLRAEPDVDPIRALRAALKVLGRRFGPRPGLGFGE